MADIKTIEMQNLAAADAQDSSEDAEKASGTTATQSRDSIISSLKKPYSYWLASLSIWVVTLLVTLHDAALPVAIPVSISPMNGPDCLCTLR